MKILLHEPENQNLALSDSSFGAGDKRQQRGGVSNGLMVGRAMTSKHCGIYQSTGLPVLDKASRGESRAICKGFCL